MEGINSLVNLKLLGVCDFKYSNETYCLTVTSHKKKNIIFNNLKNF